MPGVGVRTAEVIAVHLGDAKRFRSADEVSFSKDGAERVADGITFALADR